MEWMKQNKWYLIGGGVLLAAGYYAYKSGAFAGLGLGGDDDGLGCGCLGHSGRTASYRFPSGKKRGHYRKSSGRFHAHV